MEKQSIKVLIAEDDFLIAEDISRSLKNSGYILSGIAPNGKKAVELTKSLKPDVVLMDIKMPRMDGLEASRIIFDECPTPIVIITAHESHDLVEKASQSGIGAYLTKPPKADEIERAITIAMSRHSDLMHSKKLILELEESKKKLKELNASKDRFFSILAHDLRGPASSLTIFAEQLIENFDLFSKEELICSLREIKDASGGLSSLVDNLLLWAGFQINRVEFNPINFDIGEVINSILPLCHLPLKSKSISISKSIPSNLMVYADIEMTRTILRNLVSNAIKFSHPNGNIRIIVEENENKIKIMVGDEGVGISEDNLKKLFNIDQQFSNIGTMGEKGTGLGLLLCHEMVQKNGGEIWAESILGEGTSFSFFLLKGSN